MANLSAAQIASYATAAGFKNTGLQIAVAIALAESGGNPYAYNPETAAGTPPGSGSRGLWQIYGYAHPQYNNNSLYDPLINARAAFTLSNGGANWTPWSTYTNGAYLQYIQVTQAIGGTSKTPTVATSNRYPKGQCTWWACQRYHDLTGYYIPWMDNANGWARQAQSSGWYVSATPTAPSIIVLQAGVQLADPVYGHVGVVERVNTDGTVYTSDQNWAGITYPNTNYVTFKPGPGVSFVTANNPNTPLTLPVGFGPPPFGASTTTPTYTPLMDLVHQTLINFPGFYGIALAVDEAEQFPGYIDLTQPTTITTPNLPGVGSANVTIPDFIGLARSIGATITDNFLPFAIRTGIALMGAILLLALLIKGAEPAIRGAAMIAATG